MRKLRVSFPQPCDEQWQAMSPVNCGRVCARCDEVVHDLSLYSLDEAEALLQRDPGTCVRATIDAHGVVALKPSRANMGRMIVAGASAGLLAASPLYAKQVQPKGSISGEIGSFGDPTRVVATDQNGRSFRTKAKVDGRYGFKRLPQGTYKLTFTPYCGDSWTITDVVVGNAETDVPKSTGANVCITVGKIIVESDQG